nr:HAD domain-containing protein [uncultured Hydrogenophaga sp.]
MDFDGVLHPLGAPRDWLFDKAGMLAASLRDLEGVEIVVSSGWAGYHSLDEVRAMFQPWPALHERVVGRTEPWARPPAHGAVVPDRERQCRDWLRANGRSARHWLAIDNQRQHFAARERLLLVDGRQGLQARNLYRLVEMIHALRREEARS